MEKTTLKDEFLKGFEIEGMEEKEDFEEKITKVFEKVKYFSNNQKDEMNDEEFSCISECNSLIFQIDDEIMKIKRSLQAIYSKKFPDLERQIYNPLEYAKVVLKLQNTKDFKKVDLTDVLPQTTILILNIEFTKSEGKSLNDDELKKSIDFANKILSLDEKKKMIMEYISSRMNLIAPNLSIIVGTVVAAQLIGSVGGLTELAKISGNVIQILGQEKKNLKGFSTKSVIQHSGFIGECDIVKNVPPEIRKKIARITAMKSALAARLDAFGKNKDGEGGRKLKQEIQEAIENFQELPPPKQEKPLPIPDEKKKPRRGGKKSRKMKEKYKLTELRGKMNKVAFGVAEKEIGESGIGMGLLGVDAGSKIRVKAETKIKAKKIVDKKYGFQTNGLQTTISGIQTSGFSTIVPGVEIIQPKEKKQEKYFSNLEFKNVKK